MKLLRAFIEASGYDVEIKANFDRVSWQNEFDARASSYPFHNDYVTKEIKVTKKDDDTHGKPALPRYCFVAASRLDKEQGLSMSANSHLQHLMRNFKDEDYE